MKKFMDALKEYWTQILFAVGFISACSIFPYKVDAVQKEVAEIAQQTKTLTKWVEAQEERNKLIKAAPPGWEWSERDEKYVVRTSTNSS